MPIARLLLALSGIFVLLLVTTSGKAQSPQVGNTLPGLTATPAPAGLFPGGVGLPEGIVPGNGQVLYPIVGGIFSGYTGFWHPGMSYSIYHPTIVFTTPPNSYIDWSRIKHVPIPPREIGPPPDVLPQPRPEKDKDKKPPAGK